MKIFLNLSKLSRINALWLQKHRFLLIFMIITLRYAKKTRLTNKKGCETRQKTHFRSVKSKQSCEKIFYYHFQLLQPSDKHHIAN